MNRVVSTQWLVYAIAVAVAGAAAVRVVDMAVGLGAAFSWATTAAVLVPLWVWVFLSARNARALGATQRFSPPVALAIVIIPFVNIYGGYLVFQELWMTCEGPPPRTQSRLIKWWFRWLIWGLALTLAAGVLAVKEPALGEVAPILGLATVLGAYAMLVLAMSRISRRQLGAHKRQMVMADGTGGRQAPASRMTLLNLEFLIGVTLVVTTIFVIPALLQTMKKSKTSEAHQFLNKIYLGAKAYYEDSGDLPPSVEVTPPLEACCASQSGRCPPSSPLWDASPTWTALQFWLDDPHYGSYEYIRESDTRIIVNAYQDLDCDTTFSTFTLTGDVTDPDSVEITVENDLE